MNRTKQNGLAVITGASTGIGYELAQCAARDGYDLVIAADEEEIEAAAEDLRRHGVSVEAVFCDLSTVSGVNEFLARLRLPERQVDLLMANAGRGRGEAFLDQDIREAQRVVDTNISGTLAVVHAVGAAMRSQGRGRILFTGSIAGFMPGTFQAVYNATKAFIDNFALALREELKDTGVTVTCLMPGATETAFFERAGLEDTPIGQSKKDDPAFVAEVGYRALLDGDADVVSGWKNKVMSALANITPASLLAKQHRRMIEPEDGG